jgi:hypothetical protein
MCYAYQFQELQEFLDRTVGSLVLKDIGLEAKSGGSLLGYLSQHIAALVLCVLQYRIMKEKKTTPLLFGPTGNIIYIG